MVVRRRTLIQFLLFLIIVSLLFSYVSWKRKGFSEETAKDATGQRGTVIPDESRPDGEPVAGKAEARDFFVEYRLEREDVRSQQLELLREVINNPNSDKEARRRAQEELLAMSRKIGQELEMENLIKAKGFQDVIVFLHEGTVEVIVKAQTLSPPEVAKVADIVTRVTGVRKEGISIIAKMQ